MQSKRKGVAIQIRNEYPAALPVQCFAHSLNLSPQELQITLLRDGLETGREIAQLISLSPKRSHLFNEILAQSDCSGVTIKPLCQTERC